MVRRAVVTPDKHFPLADYAAINVVCKAIEIVEPDTYIDLGDVGEWEGSSHWKWKKKKRPPLEYMMPSINKDVEDVNAGMDIIDEALDKVNCKNKHMVEGNHDDWMNRFSEEHPYLSYRFKDIVRLKERGYEYHPCGLSPTDYLKIGKLSFYHGHHFASMHHAKNHLNRLGGNVMYGHHHDVQVASVTHMDGVKSAYSIGCLKDMSADKNAWLGGRPNNWQQAFAIVDFYDKGKFTVDIVQIIEGKAMVWGNLIDGNK